MKVLWLTNIPSPYRVDFFNELGKKCDLTILFERSNASNRDRSWKNYEFNYFKGIFMSGIRFSNDKAVSIEFVKFLNSKYDIIVVSNPFTPTGMMAILYMKMRGIKYVIVSDGGLVKRNNLFKYHFKRVILSNAHHYMCTGKSHEEYYLNYGAKKSRITKYPFTSLFEKDILGNIIEDERKIELKKILKINYDVVIIAVGRFVYSKGFDVLIEACKNMKNVGLLVIGGKPTEEYLELVNINQLDHVQFLDHMSKESLKKYYQASDVFVLPTRGDVWGLVVNEAMSNGLPVLTTNKCVAGLELVDNGINGYLTQVDDIDKLQECIDELIKDCELRKKMGRANLNKISKYTIEEMVKVHLDVFEDIQNND